MSRRRSSPCTRTSRRQKNEDLKVDRNNLVVAVELQSENDLLAKVDADTAEEGPLKGLRSACGGIARNGDLISRSGPLDRIRR